MRLAGLTVLTLAVLAGMAVAPASGRDRRLDRVGTAMVGPIFTESTAVFSGSDGRVSVVRPTGAPLTFSVGDCALGTATRSTVVLECGAEREVATLTPETGALRRYPVPGCVTELLSVPDVVLRCDGGKALAVLELPDGAVHRVPPTPGTQADLESDARAIGIGRVWIALLRYTGEFTRGLSEITEKIYVNRRTGEQRRSPGGDGGRPDLDAPDLRVKPAPAPATCAEGFSFATRPATDVLFLRTCPTRQTRRLPGCTRAYAAGYCVAIGRLPGVALWTSDDCRTIRAFGLRTSRQARWRASPFLCRAEPGRTAAPDVARLGSRALILTRASGPPRAARTVFRLRLPARLR